MRNYCNVSVSFPAQKSKIKLKIAMKTWDILKATYLRVIVRENQADDERWGLAVIIFLL